MKITSAKKAFSIVAMVAVLMSAFAVPTTGAPRLRSASSSETASSAAAGPSCRKCKKVVRKAKRCKRQGDDSAKCKKAKRQARKCKKILKGKRCRKPSGGGGPSPSPSPSPSSSPSQAPAESCPAGFTCLWLHGTNPDGDAEAAEHTANGTFMQMDPVKPTEPTASKSRQITNYGAGPNTQCAGNNLFPVWQGKMAGTITGDITFTFHAVTSPPVTVEVRVWPDIVAQACNEAYPEPARKVQVELPAGQAEVQAVLSGADIEALGSVMVQITPILPTEGGVPFEGRVFYDAENALSVFSFQCTPPSGASSCTP